MKKIIATFAICSLGLLSVLMYQGKFITWSKVSAATLPHGFSIEKVADLNFGRPMSLAVSPDGRVFITKKDGEVRIVKNGKLLSAPFMTLSVDNHHERGLMGIALHPQFISNGYVYVMYTPKNASPSKNIVSRFTADPQNPDKVLPGSEKIIIDNIFVQSSIHNGGAIHFGNDGKLYVTTGDSGPGATAQDMSILLGKVLRVNADGTIPSDNPFVGQQGKRPEIWASGFRNPFTFAVDPVTGDIFVNDVGAQGWEEINKLVKGANYGWPRCEGICSVTGMTNPIHAYPHTVGHSITGGTFYRGNSFPAEFKGKYFFADYTDGFIKVLDPATKKVTDFADGLQAPVDLAVSYDGGLYYLSNVPGTLYKITWNSNSPGPIPPAPPSPPPPSPPPATPGNKPPVSEVTTNIHMYKAGWTIQYKGTATDPEDGVLPGSAYEWSIDFHHDTHTHPFIGSIKGKKEGSFSVPTTGETDANVWYRIILKVTDSKGATHVSYKDVRPYTVNITVASNVSGITIDVNDQPKHLPHSFVSVEGFKHVLEAPERQTVGVTTYEFVRWEHGKDRRHTITAPTNGRAVTYTAVYKQVGTSQPPEEGGGSTITIYAAGTSAKGVFPTMDLLVDGKVVKTFSNIRGNSLSRMFEAFTYTSNTKISASKIRVRYVNDDWDPVKNEDRNLRVDRIVIDGVTYQTEAPQVHSTGSWVASAQSCVPGNHSTEWLYCNGYFQY